MAQTVTLDDEDRVRADCYGMLAALLAQAPDASLLDALGSAPRLAGAPGQPFAEAYNGLLDASAAAGADAVRQEYDDLFVGVGRSEVDPHAAHWKREPGGARSLVEVKSDLARLGLSRLPGSPLYEDHVAALFETMRILIAGQGNRAPSPLEVQRTFFDRHIEPWIGRFCSAIYASTLANYYRQVAEFTDCFVAIERDAFAID
jgi:TorA maturation chaperone TorD